MNLPNGRPHAREVMMKIIIIGVALTVALQPARRCSLYPANWKEGKRPGREEDPNWSHDLRTGLKIC